MKYPRPGGGDLGVLGVDTRLHEHSAAAPVRFRPLPPTVLYLKWQERGASLPRSSGFDSQRDHQGQRLVGQNEISPKSPLLTAGKDRPPGTSHSGGYIREPGRLRGRFESGSSRQKKQGKERGRHW